MSLKSKLISAGYTELQAQTAIERMKRIMQGLPPTTTFQGEEHGDLCFLPERAKLVKHEVTAEMIERKPITPRYKNYLAESNVFKNRP